MPLEIEKPGNTFPVTRIDADAEQHILSEGGTINRQPDFMMVTLPRGTKHRSIRGGMLYKLPSETILRLSEHWLSIE